MIAIWLGRIGLLLVGVAGGADVLVHGLGPAHPLWRYTEALHFAAAFGMLVTLASLFAAMVPPLPQQITFKTGNRGGRQVCHLEDS